MKILITRFPFVAQLGGEEYHTLNLFEAIQKQLPNTKVSFLGSCPVFLKEFKKRNWSVFPAWGWPALVTKLNLFTFTLALPFLIPYLFIKLYFLNKKNKFDVLYCHSINDKLIITPIAKLLGIKRIVWVEHQRIRNWLMLNPYRIFYKLWSSWGTIVPISYYNQKQLQKLNISPNNIVDIPHGVYQVTKIKNYDHPKYSQEYFNIIAISRFIKEKGVDYLIKAVQNLQNKHQLKIKLTLISNGPEKTNLQKLASGNPDIIFAGNFPNQQILEEILPQQDLLVLPSIDNSETFGLVAAESMMQKIPVIVTNVCGISYYLTNQASALVIPPKDITALEESILKLANDFFFRKKIATNGYRLALDKFDFERMVEKYLNILDRNSKI